MEVKQIYEFVNDATKQALGEEATILTEDLSNIVDVGTAVANANAYDSYVKALVNRIGRTIFVSRKYEGTIPSVIFDGWEYGSIMEKISGGLPEAQENETWELEDGQSYDPNVFKKPTVSVKFFNKRWTFEVQLSITDEQVKQSFTSREELGRFVEMLYNDVDKSIEVKVDSLVMRTLNGAIAETIHDDYGNSALGSMSGVKAVNLLKLWNDDHSGSELDVEGAMKSPEFIRFASVEIMKYADRMKKMSKLFNVGKQPRFTPRDALKIILHADFEANAKAYLYSTTFHEEYVKLPKADVVPYFQTTGEKYAFEDTSAIKVKLPSDSSVTVEASGIIGMLFDRDALGVVNYKRYTTSNYNAKAEFTNFFHKLFAGNFVDLNENIVVFFLAEAE